MDVPVVVFTNSCLGNLGQQAWAAGANKCLKEMFDVAHGLAGKAGMNATGIEHPVEALRTIEKQPFDLLILDVNMPRMDGHELCVKLRAIPSRARTPIVFVTSLSGFERCARAAPSGGNDLVAKPIFPIALAVKAIMFALKSRLGIVTKSA